MIESILCFTKDASGEGSPEAKAGETNFQFLWPRVSSLFWLRHRTRRTGKLSLADDNCIVVVGDWA